MTRFQRRVRRLETILLRTLPPRNLTAEDLRFQGLCAELLGRVDAVYAQEIQQEDSVRAEKERRGRATSFSNLSFGFYSTVREHLFANTPLEFPAIVAQAYISYSGAIDMVACLDCHYCFPWGIGNDPFPHCPLCRSTQLQSRGFK